MSKGVGKLDLVIAADEIRNLKCRYFRFVDTHDWSDLTKLFFADAEFDTRRIEASDVGLIERGQLAQGREAILRFIAEGMAGSISSMAAKVTKSLSIIRPRPWHRGDGGSRHLGHPARRDQCTDLAIIMSDTGLKTVPGGYGVRR